jgi:hypothetical protein
VDTRSPPNQPQRPLIVALAVFRAPRCASSGLQSQFGGRFLPGPSARQRRSPHIWRATPDWNTGA